MDHGPGIVAEEPRLGPADGELLIVSNEGEVRQIRPVESRPQEVVRPPLLTRIQPGILVKPMRREPLEPPFDAPVEIARRREECSPSLEFERWKCPHEPVDDRSQGD